MTRRLDKLKLLVVDDNTHMTKIVKTIMRGFDVKDLFDADNAADAFDIVRGTPIDLIITDFAMEPVNGCDFVRLVRTAADSPNQFIPIIMLTAYTERTKVEQARDAGITEFCAKPVTATELYRKVCMVINSPRAFVRTGVYFGPDRRRRNGDDFSGEERRENPYAKDVPADAARQSELAGQGR